MQCLDVPSAFGNYAEADSQQIGGKVTENEKPGVHDIAYICISDMHLGEEYSLLTNIEGGNLDTGKASEIMVKLVDCLEKIIDQNVTAEREAVLA